eukprot:1143037-Pelagomonas_calceolata.AAC.1
MEKDAGIYDGSFEVKDKAAATLFFALHMTPCVSVLLECYVRFGFAAAVPSNLKHPCTSTGVQ